MFEHGRGNDMPEIKGTAWAAFNAVTEYVSYNANNDIDKRYNSIWFGQGKKQLQLALNTVTSLVTA